MLALHEGGNRRSTGESMNTQQRPRGPLNRTHINVNEGFELRYWAKDLGVSLEQVKSAVRKVGAALVDVRAELTRQNLGRS